MNEGDVVQGPGRTSVGLARKGRLIPSEYVMSKVDYHDYEHNSTPHRPTEPVDKLNCLGDEHARIMRALGFTTGSLHADRCIFRERFEEWRWRRVSHWRKQGSLR